MDLLIPAAVQNQLTSVNAHRVKASTVVEAANGPSTSDADAVLADRGAVVVPDILASAGGVTVSYFEWVQNRSGWYWSEAEVHDRLGLFMVGALESVLDGAERENVSLRTAAYAVALRRLGEAISAQGTRSYFGRR